MDTGFNAMRMFFVKHIFSIYVNDLTPSSAILLRNGENC